MIMLQRPKRATKLSVILELSSVPEFSAGETEASDVREMLVNWLFKLNRGEHLALFHCVADQKVYEQIASHQCFCSVRCKQRMKVRRMRVRKRRKGE